MPRVLLSSVARPLGPRHGDATSVGYELLHAQVTRAQGVFSPRNVAEHFGLDYIAANLEAPAVVLQYPSESDFVRELRRGDYSHVGIGFNLTTAHRMRRMAGLVRRHAPRAALVLGGYGTALPDTELLRHGDEICRGEGVRFMRALLGESEIEPPHVHPLILSPMRLLSVPLQSSALIFAGLGCPNGCDFCSTSHHFNRRYHRLLPTGRDLFDVISAYEALRPDLNYTVLDEEFLLDRKRALELRDLVQAAELHLDLFVFASVKALSQYTAEELVEIGVGGVWIGFEGLRAGYAKMGGRPLTELIPELRRHGIAVLTSMILGLDYHTPEIIRQEFEALMALVPTYAQFTVYAPLLGTALAARIEHEQRWRPEYREDLERRSRFSDGFHCLFEHPHMSGEQIEELQRWCFAEDYRRLGPSVVRYSQTWLTAWEGLRHSRQPALRRRAAFIERQLQNTGGLIPLASALAPSAMARIKVRELGRNLPRPARWQQRWLNRLVGLASFPLAGYTSATLGIDAMQHPRTRRHDWGGKHPPPAVRPGS